MLPEQTHQLIPGFLLQTEVARTLHRSRFPAPTVLFGLLWHPSPLTVLTWAQKSPAAFPTPASAQDACDSGFVITARKFHREKSKNLYFSFMSFIKLTILQVIVTTTFIPCPHYLPPLKISWHCLLGTLCPFQLGHGVGHKN